MVFHGPDDLQRGRRRRASGHPPHLARGAPPRRGPDAAPRGDEGVRHAV